MSFNGNQYGNFATKVITTRGDIIRGSSTGARERLGLGSSTQVLTSDGTDIDWAAAGGAPTTTKGDLSGYSTTAARIPISTNNFSLFGDSTAALGLKWAASPTSTLDATGAMLYASGANTLAKLAAGTQYYNLQQGASVPAWAASSTSTLTTTGDTLYASGANTIARLAAGSTSGHILTSNGSGAAPSWQAAAGGNPPIAFIANNTTEASSNIPAGYLIECGVVSGKNHAGVGGWAYPDTTKPATTPVGTDIKMFSAGINISQHTLSGTWTGTKAIAIADAQIYPTGTGDFTDTGLSDVLAVGDTLKWTSWSPSGSGTWNSKTNYIAFSLEATT